jgi:hypothetical protein
MLLLVQVINNNMENLPVIPEGSIIISRNKGHTKTLGKAAGEEKNYSYLVKNKDGEEVVYLWCNSKWTIIDKDKLNFVKQYNNEEVTWFYASCGYIMGHIYIDGVRKSIYIHQILTGHLFPGKGSLSVDHINRNKLDNRLSNLSIVDQAEQNRNCGKRNRKHNAQKLPSELHGIELPKYVVYYKETLNKGKNNESYREFFRIENILFKMVKRNLLQNQIKYQLLIN